MNIRFFLITLAVFFIGVAGLFSWSAYGYYQTIHADDPIDPSLIIEAGKGKIIRGDTAIELGSGELYTLETNDAVETAKESTAVITWPDRSITRLGPDTRIVIEKMMVSKSYDSIKISYNIEKGKVWNTVIRLLVGESYFEAHLPKDNIVAGVRGTVFEVNLDGGYIHAVDHATHLSDRSGKSLDLLPGELVSSENIWVKKGKEWLDTSWQEWNSFSDRTYESIRALELQKRIDTLSGNTGSFFSSIIRKILSYIHGFEAIDIASSLSRGNIDTLKKYSKETLLEYYQKASSLSTLDTRDILRASIIEKIGNTAQAQGLKSLLENASVWESIDTGKVLPSAEKFLKERGIDTTDFSKKFQNGFQNDTKKLLDGLSGSLQGVMRF